MYQIYFTKAALKQLPNLKAAKLDGKAKALIEILKENPYQNPPPYEKLVGDLKTAYSREERTMCHTCFSFHFRSCSVIQSYISGQVGRPPTCLSSM